MYGYCWALAKKYVFSVAVAVAHNLLAFAVSVPFTITFAALSVLHFFYKWIVLITCSYDKKSPFYGACRKMLKGLECAWLEDHWQPCLAQSVLVFDSKIDVHRIKELMLTRVLPAYPRLTHRAKLLPYTAGSVHCWLRDEAFDIDKHVVVENARMSDEQLQRYINNKIREKLPVEKPPWELRVVTHRADHSTDTVVVLRIHRDLANVTTMIKILCTKLSDANKTTSPIFENDFKMSHYVRLLQALCVGPALILYRLAVSSLQRYANTATRGAAPAPTSMAGEESKCIVNWLSHISLGKIDRVKQVTRSSSECVMLTAITGGVRCLLQNSGIKHPPDLKVILPVEVGKNEKPVYVTTDIPVSVEGAIPRLWQTKYRLKTLRNSYDLFVIHLISGYLLRLCPVSLKRGVKNIYKKSASIQYSETIGPTSRLVIDGSPLKSVYALLPLKTDLGINISAVSYAEQVCVSTITHNSLGNVGKLLLNYISDQVDRMYVLLENRTIPDDISSDYFQDQLPDISQLSVKDLKCKMQGIQSELQRLSEIISYSEEDVKRFARFKCEFNHVFKELRRRKSAKVKIRRRSVFLQGVGSVTSAYRRRHSSAAATAAASAPTVIYPFSNDSATEEDIPDCPITLAEEGRCAYGTTAGCGKVENGSAGAGGRTGATGGVNLSVRSLKRTLNKNVNSYIYATLVRENRCGGGDGTAYGGMSIIHCSPKSYAFSYSRSDLLYQLGDNEHII